MREKSHKYNLSNDSDADDSDVSSSASSSSHGQHVIDVRVSNSDIGSLNELIASMLGISAKETLSLSNLVLIKTDGNTYYVLHFLDMLVRRSLLCTRPGRLSTYSIALTFVTI